MTGISSQAGLASIRAGLPLSYERSYEASIAAIDHYFGLTRSRHEHWLRAQEAVDVAAGEALAAEVPLEPIPYQTYPTPDYAEHIAVIDDAAREMSRRIVADREAALAWTLTVAQMLELTDRDRRVAGLGYTVPDGVPISGDHRPVWARA